MSHRSLVQSLLALLVVVAASAPLRADDTLFVLGGDQRSAEIVEITSEGAVRLKGVQQPLALADLRLIQREGVAAQPKSAVAVHLASGGVLLGSDLTVESDICQLTWLDGQKLDVPLELVRAVRLHEASTAPAGGLERFQKAIAASAENDQLFVLAGAQMATAQGLLEAVTTDKVRFAYKEKTQQAARSKVFGIVIASVGDPPSRDGKCLVTLADGSTLWASVEQLAEGKLQLAAADRLDVTVPWDRVVSLEVSNNRLFYLSDLEPTRVQQQAIVTLPRPYQRDANVLGGAMQIGDEKFEKGLGVHSRCELTYDNPGCDLFLATIGIDASSGGRGDCEFVVLLDGRESFRKRVRAADGMTDISVEFAPTARKITLLVEPGADLDLADHADWADARLVRQNADSSTAEEEDSE